MNLKTKMEKIIHHSYPNIAGVCVRKKDEVVYESYLNGSSPETTVHVFFGYEKYYLCLNRDCHRYGKNQE